MLFNEKSLKDTALYMKSTSNSFAFLLAKNNSRPITLISYFCQKSNSMGTR